MIEVSMPRGVLLLLLAGFAYAQSTPSPQEILKQAIAAQQSGRLDEAIKNYRLLLKSYPEIPEIRSNFGAALAGEGRYSEAITEYKRALALKPNAQVELNLALAYYKTADFTRALELLKKLRRQEPANMQVVTVLADCELRLGQNKDVIELLTPVQQMYPDNATYIYLLGTALVRDGQTSKGQLIIDKILRNGDSAEARLLMGTTKYMAKDFSGARDEFQKALDLNADLPDVHAYYGMALLATGDPAGAKQAFERELKINPNNFDANLQMGLLLRQDEQNNEAIGYLQHALQIRPGDPGVRYQIAVIEIANGQLDHARGDLESLIKDSPDFLEAHVSLATVYFRQKRRADGERERAIVAKLNVAKQATNEVAAQAAK
jgi:tetratricopeptide (TPR) repeat protein